MGLGRLLRVLLGNSFLLVAYCLGFWVMADSLLKERLQSFIECEGESCSFDPELITPEYVYRMWGYRPPEIRPPDDAELPQGNPWGRHQYDDGCRSVQHEALDEQTCLVFFCVIVSGTAQTPGECVI